MRTRGLCLLAIMISSPERAASISPDNFAFASCICTVLNEIQKSKKKIFQGLFKYLWENLSGEWEDNQTMVSQSEY